MNVTMMMTICGVVVLGLYVMYARQIQLRNIVSSAFSSIEIQLRKRYDLIPQVLKLANKYMQHERSLLEDITALRNAANDIVKADSANDADTLFKADAKLMSKMGSLNVAMEAYPELKSNKTMTKAMSTYQDVEDNISAARRFYNASVVDLNNAIEIFPGSIVAPLSKAKVMPFYEDIASDKIATQVDVDNYM